MFMFVITLSYDDFVLKIKNRFPIFGYVMHDKQNQKSDGTLKNQLFKIYNFVAWSKKIR